MASSIILVGCSLYIMVKELMKFCASSCTPDKDMRSVISKVMFVHAELTFAAGSRSDKQLSLRMILRLL